MKTIIIDGEILCDERMDGIHRFMIETLSRIDRKLPDSGFKIEIVHSKGREIKGLDLKNIKTVALKKNRLTYRIITLPAYVKKKNGIYCSMSNDVILYKNSICTLMDLIPLSGLAKYPWKSLWKMKLIYRLIKRNSKLIVTISNASKNDIVQKLKVSPEKITLVGTGWEHMNRIQEDDSIFERFPDLEKGNYYYAIGNQYPYKNFKWVTEVAKRNPASRFVVAGKVTNIARPVEDSESNMLYVGYISDGEHKALLKNARAFLHPSKLEGFGIPPLEALSQGVSIAVSTASCLPEIYQDAAHYFDPDDYEVNLDRLMNEPVEGCEALLKKYSWDQVAKDWMDIFGTMV